MADLIPEGTPANGIPAPTPTDWIGLFAPGSADFAFIEWIYVSCSQIAAGPAASGSCSFPIPASLPAGLYELRLLASDGFLNRLATSGAITVGN